MKRILVPALLICFHFLYAQNKKPFFHNINVSSGLPERFVIASLQDHDGFMWLGTQNGVVRYDGYQLKSYPMYDSANKPLVIPSVVYFFEDDQHVLWTHVLFVGLFYFDREQNAFIKQQWANSATDSMFKRYVFIDNWVQINNKREYLINLIDYDDSTSRVYNFNAAENILKQCVSSSENKSVYAKNSIELKKDFSGKIWLITDTVLSSYNVAQKRFEPFITHPQSDLHFKNFQPDPIDSNVLWLSSFYRNDNQKTYHEVDILMLNTVTKKWNVLSTEKNQSSYKSAYNGNHIYLDSLKRIWVSNNSNIYLYNHQNRSFKRFDLPFSLVNSLSKLVADTKGNLWLSEGKSTFYYLNTTTGKIIEYNNRNTSGFIPKNLQLNKLFVDRWGTFWLTYEFNGIHFMDKAKTEFTPVNFDINPNSSSTSAEKPSQSLKGHDGDSVNFIVDNKQLFWYNINNGEYSKIDLKNPEVYHSISIIKRDSRNNLWIGTFGAGLIKYNIRSKQISQFKHAANNPASISSNDIICFEIDQNNNLWLGTRNGLCYFNSISEKATRYPFAPPSGTTKPTTTLDDNTVISLLFDSKGALWIGTNQGGLNKLDTATQLFTSYTNRGNGIVCVTSILEDSKKRFWFSTYLAGIFLLDRESGTFKRYSEKEGLLGNTSSLLSEDRDGNIVSFNERGISILNPTTEKITTYPFPNLNIKSEFKNGYVDSKKIFHFNNEEGISHFDLTKLNDDIKAPSIVLESIKYRGNNKQDTIVPIIDSETLKLAYNENNLEIEFVAINYSILQDHRYAYKLYGFDKDWVSNGTLRHATYTNLPAGDYIFMVTTTKPDGTIYENVASFSFSILPPWWRTWWAYLLYIFISVFAIRQYIQHRSKSLQQKNEVLEEKVLERTQQLQQSISDLKATQAQLIQSEKMAGLGELTAGIAHEIQNPLNFVNNFSELSVELLGEMKSELETGNTDVVTEIANDLKQNLDKINHHGKRAENIVKAMLMHSRSSKGHKEKTNLNNLIEEYVRLAYHGLRAKDKSFNAAINFDLDQTIGEIQIVPQDIGRVILNLATNAFYAVNEKKIQLQKQGNNDFMPALKVSTKFKTDDNKWVSLTVSDNGNGITEENINKIFQPFFTTKPTGQGTGLGLSLTYDIIKAHQGIILVNSTVDIGTTFVIELPYS
jgi:signal transduction histidine kinase/ligand-binding sensor domain-containing protein